MSRFTQRASPQLMNHLRTWLSVYDLLFLPIPHHFILLAISLSISAQMILSSNYLPAQLLSPGLFCSFPFCFFHHVQGSCSWKAVQKKFLKSIVRIYVHWFHKFHYLASISFLFFQALMVSQEIFFSWLHTFSLNQASDPMTPLSIHSSSNSPHCPKYHRVQVLNHSHSPLVSLSMSIGWALVVSILVAASPISHCLWTSLRPSYL